MDYPGRVIVQGETDKKIVGAIQRRLEEAGCGPVDARGTFGPQTRASVKLFQARNVDDHGAPLKQDGKIGLITWTALFGAESVPSRTDPGSPFLGAVLSTAATQLAVREQPKNSNSGPEVDSFLKRAGVPLSLPASKKPWCCAFVYWCFDETAKAAGRTNPMTKTAGCLVHWQSTATTGARRIPAAQARQDPSLVAPGAVFIMDHGGGKGHTGFVTKVAGGFVHTIEGNTDASLTREGGGVFELKRKIIDINKGFIDYSAL